MNDRILEIGRIERKSGQDGGSVVSANVDGQRLWFESQDELEINADAFLCAFLLQAMASGRTLSLADPVDAKLLSAVPEIAALAGSWWGYRSVEIRCPTVTRPAAGGDAMFFTSGVDSFYTLWRNRASLGHLINIHGFDIALDDTDRFMRSAESIRRAADATGCQPLFVATNMRSHPTFASVSWNKCHIAALAAVAHLLRGRVQRVFVASSDVPPPFGSHPDLDRLWSSSAVEIVNDERDVSRLDKIRAFADWPIAHQTLKVCWENRSSALNCGECEKCVRSSAQLKATGILDKVTTFPRSPLAPRINALSGVSSELVRQWQDILAETHDRDEADAIRALLQRTARSGSKIAKWKKRLSKLFAN